MRKIVIALDQGTSSSRAIAFNHKGEKLAVCQKEFPQIYPADGWVEHEPYQIWTSQYEVLNELLDTLGIVDSDSERIQCDLSTQEVELAIGITNQRETVLLWDAKTGEPVYNAIVWQDRRTAKYCDFLNSHGYLGSIKTKTGLLIDPYFSGTKVKWILDNVPGVRQRAEKGEIKMGTIDTFLLWKLTEGKVHATDVTNASRTMLFNINTLEWDDELLKLFDIPKSILPEVKPSSHIYAYINLCGHKVPIASIIGDQQSALFGQLCTEKGDVKNTYGTGGFLLMNTGSNIVWSKNRLLSTIAWQIGKKVCYALEGSVFIAGAAVQWLRDGIGIIKNSAEVEELASKVQSSEGVYFVPALTGLGAPYWNANARGTIAGLSRSSTASHIARATLEGIAFETADVVHAMRNDAGVALRSVKVDGGAARNNLLMQIQSDVLGVDVLRPIEVETTALGAAFMAGLAVGMWESVEQLKTIWKSDRAFSPQCTEEHREKMLRGWKRAVRAACVEDV